MFDLKSAIADWRKQMLAAGIQSSAMLDELESHLREEIAQQMKCGWAEQKAFELATAKIGLPASLGLEFKKSGGADAVPEAKRVGRFFSVLTAVYAFALSVILIKHPLSPNERLLGFAAVAAMLASVFVAWRIGPRFCPVITDKRVQSAIGLIGGISGMGWFFAFVFLILPRCDFTDGQLLVAVFWALVPVMALPTAAFLILGKSENQRTTTPL
jgi:hypothetical protein